VSIFGKIKDAIFGHKAQAATPAQAPQSQAGSATAAAAPAANAPAEQVDVDAVLTQIAAGKGNPNLNYRSSIVDLLKLLDIDPSLDNRKSLATELGYTGATDGSAEMNIWLHKAVMKQLAANGGKVPAELLD
jgi:3-oxoacyl-ACP reductase-like protein